MTNSIQYHIFKCATCEDMPEFGYPDFIEHLKKVHHSGDRPQGNRSLGRHVDSHEWFGGTYTWVFDFDGDIVEAVESFRMPRHKDDRLLEQE